MDPERSPASAPAGAPVVRFNCVSRTIRRRPALDHVSLDVHAGEFHAIYGGDNAGKSALFETLAGLEAPDSGEVLVDGRVLEPGSVDAARKSGVVLLSPETSLVPAMTVAENIFLNREPRTRWGMIDNGRTVDLAREMLAANGLSIDATQPVGRLAPEDRPVIALLRVLATRPRLVGMDEPFADLSDDAAAFFSRNLRRLRDLGGAVLSVVPGMRSQAFLDADRISVMRNGRIVFTGDAAEVASMNGFVAAARSRLTSPEPLTAPLLEVEGLGAADGSLSVSFTVGRGEIVGIACPDEAHAGRLARLLTGEAGSVQGMMRFNEPAAGPVGRIDAGRLRAEITLRHRIDGEARSPLFAEMTQWRCFTGGRTARSISDAFPFLQGGVEPPPMPNLASVEVGKWEPIKSRVLVLDNALADVGVGTRAEIVPLVRDTAHEGHGLVVLSPDPIELLAIADRILVMDGGRIIGRAV